MHIPDGYLSPQTFVPLFGVMIPVWAVAARKVKGALRTRQVPLLAIGAAFSFVLMMINIPAPGGTSGHAVGGAIIAILLGPWAGCIAISLTLVIQALFFGDGGITSLAANSFDMALVMPFVASFCFRLIAGRSPAVSRRRVIAGFISGYLALNAAALYTAVIFGLQPLLASAPDGHPLYAPFSLSVAVPAMVLPHLFLFGIIEGLVTAYIISYLQKAEPDLLSPGGPGAEASAGTVQKLRLGVGVLALLAPLAIVPWSVQAGRGWGEWNGHELEALIGFVPEGVTHLGELWRAPLADYSFAATGRAGVMPSGMSYLLSVVLGIAVIVFCLRLWERLVAGRDEK